MNSYERNALKRANESKAKWKDNALERNPRLRAAQLKIPDLEKRRPLWRDRCLLTQQRFHQEDHVFPLC
jgi:hypothetical protein